MDDISVGLGTAKAQSETEKTCATCGRPLTQCGPNGECLRCLVSLTFLGDGEQPERPAARGRLTPGPLRYAHFEAETGADGFPMELGAGAMAITYRARDTVLNSLVALKVIDRKVAQNPGARSRFLREARAAANIRHPNVARVTYYGEQDGECFYAMELVEGETLEACVRSDGPMPLAVALDAIEQAARALAAAEACGVVHRDIKPSNVMLESDPSGALRVKLIDYGVAKVMGPQTQSGAEQTHAGFIGTPAFASPEQFAGAGQLPVDTRSDIYSLGVTLWYLLTGRTPFVGRTMEEIRARQTAELPLEQLKGLHLPGQVVALLKSMLAPDPKDRPQTARDLLSAVHRCYERFNPQARSRRKRFALAGAALALAIVAIALGAWLYQHTRPFTPMERSIAVLPFGNLSSDKENAYFVEGIQDEILTRLSKIADLKVISRTSTQQYKSAPDNLREIAKQLGVAHILEGSVQKSADAVRVNVQLIKAANDSHLWADTFDRKLTDIFAVETEIAKTVADTLQAKLTGSEKQAIAVKPTENPEAHELYLKARFFWNKRTSSDLKTAIQYFNQAIEKDPGYALAYAGLADAYAILTAYAAAPVSESLPRAEIAAKKALELDESLAEAHTSLGLLLFYNLDFQGSTKEFERAIALNPNYATAHHWYGLGPLRCIGNFDKAIAELNRALRLDPLSLIINADLGVGLMTARRYDESIVQLRKTVEMDPYFYYAHLHLGKALQLNGQLAEAMTEYKKAAALNDDPLVLGLLAQGYAKLGKRDEALKTLEQLQRIATQHYVWNYTFALVHIALGQNDKAIDYLERDYRDHADYELALIKVDPMLDPLRGDPRFEALVSKVFAPK